MIELGYRLNEETGEVENVITAREKIVRRLMNFLNGRNLFGYGGYFQTDFGILHLYMGRHGWEYKWIELLSLPSGFDPNTPDHMDKYPYIELEEDIVPGPIPYYADGYISDKYGNWQEQANDD